jgi:hypothetical protein
MGLLTLFTKPASTLHRLPSGSFTVTREGKVLIGTLPSTFPIGLVRDIADQVLGAFREADAAQLPLSVLTINYPSLKITAREMRGGAMVFLAPREPYAPAS